MPEGDVFTRWCGTIVIVIVLTPKDEYSCIVSDDDDEVSLVLGPPAVLTKALDSDETIDSVAHAALAFAIFEHPKSFQSAESKPGGNGWRIRRTEGY